VGFDNNLHSDTWTKNPLLGFTALGMVRAFDFYLLFLIDFMVVARDRIELPTRGFSGPVKSISY